MAKTSKNNFNSMDEAIEMLTEGIVDIYFVKVTDGNIRRMHCTLNKKFIPYGEYGTVGSVIENSIREDSIIKPLPVWDLLVSGWRSFYLNTTIEIQPSLIFGDTTQLIEEIVGERGGIAEEITEEMEGDMIESVSDMLKFKISKAIKESPEKIIDFSFDKIKELARNLLRSVISGKKKS